MARGNETTTKFKVDISELKKGIQEANRQIKLANAEFKAASASMDSWGKSADGLTAKISQTEKVLKAQKAILNDYQKQLALIVAEYGENSKEADEMRIKIENQRATVIKTQKSLGDYKTKLSDLEAEQKKAAEAAKLQETGLAKLKKVISDQESSLKALKTQYANVAIEQGKDSTAAKKLAAEIDKLSSELVDNKKKLTDAQYATDSLGQEQVDTKNAVQKLIDTIDAQQSELDQLKTKYKSVVLEQGANSDSAKALAGDIDRLSTELSENRGKLQEVDNAADDLDKSLDDAAESAQDAGNGGFTVLKGALANLVADGIELALQGLKKLGDAIIEVGKKSLSNYAEYEQLVGGVETLFGAQGMSLEDYAKSVGKSTSAVKKEYDSMMRAQTTVFDNASKAYTAACMSANDYMETVTGFSASLIQGLGGDTEKAAKIADRAITDMSDNANKMGTDMSLIQNAYQGFAKQNYTMLDNLKLGYGGTQSEMARLINDSGVLGDEIKVTAETVNDVSFDKMIEAIHKVQDEMGITGTTAAEAASTIEGSKNAMQAAWQNLLTGLADEDADVGALFDSFMASAETYLGNILPRIEALVSRAVDFVKEKLEEKFPAAMEVVEKVFSAAKGAFGWIMDNKDAIIAALAGIGAAIVAWNIATVVTNIVKMVKAIKMMGAASAFAAAKQWLLNTALFANPIGLVVAAIAGLVTAFVVLWKKSEGFRKFWIDLWEKIKSVASAVWQAISGFFTAAWDKIKAVWGGITGFFSGLWEGIKRIFSTIADWINTNVFQPIMAFFQPVIDFFATAFEIIFQLAEGCWNAIKAIWEVVSTWFNENIIQPVSGFFSGLWDGISSAASTAWNVIKGVWSAVKGWFTNNVVNPVKNAFSTAWDALKNGASKAWDGIKSVFTPIVDWFKDKFSKAWQAVKDVFSTGGKIFDGIKDGIVSAFKAVVNAIIRGINKVIAIPFNAINGILDKIRNASILGYHPFENLISRFDVPQIPELKQGGVLKRGQVGLLEGDGAEAVVPLENNKKWIAATAAELKKALTSEGVIGVHGGASSAVTNNYNFTQNNTSPKALSRLEIYRQSKNLLQLKGAT